MDEKYIKDSYSNLNRNSKWLGVIDYKTLIILLIIVITIWNVLGIFIHNLIYRVYILGISIIPFWGIIYSNKSQENISEIIYVVLRYIVSPKLYIYNVECNNREIK